MREDEWEAIEARFDVDYEIVAARSDGQGSPYITQPTVCEPCLASRLESEEMVRTTPSYFVILHILTPRFLVTAYLHRSSRVYREAAGL